MAEQENNKLDKDRQVVAWNPWITENGYTRYNSKNYRLPVQKIRDKRVAKNEGQYKVPSESRIVVCERSDFFIQEADALRKEAWEFIHERQDCLFEIVTYIPNRISQVLPDNWLSGWKNVLVRVRVRNKLEAQIRIPQLLNSSIIYKGIYIKPVDERIDLREYLCTNQISTVTVSGDRLGVTKLDDVKYMSEQCKDYGVDFEFKRTGSNLEVNKQKLSIREKDESELAKFYRLDNHSNKTIILEDIKEAEDRKLSEDAFRIYTKLQEQRRGK